MKKVRNSSLTAKRSFIRLTLFGRKEAPRRGVPCRAPGISSSSERSSPIRFQRLGPSGSAQLHRAGFEQGIHLTASRNFTEFNGSVTKLIPLDIEFSLGQVDMTVVAPTVDIDQIDRRGVVLIDGNCYAKDSTIWASAGVHTFQVFPTPAITSGAPWSAAPSWAFPNYFTLNIKDSTSFMALFEPTKRVRFATNPPGLLVLVDRAPVTPGVLDYRPVSNIDYCNSILIPIKVPLGINPLCVGDYDFIPGSVHQIGAEPIQTNADGDFWIFDRFDNGMGQNGQYVTPTDTRQREDITALFIHGVRSSVDSNARASKLSLTVKTLRRILTTGSFGPKARRITSLRPRCSATARDACGSS